MTTHRTPFRHLRDGLTASALLLALGVAASADVLQVPAEYSSIQAAVDAAAAGDVVKIRAGAYVENVVVGTAGITLRGHDATIDGRYAGPCLQILADDVTVEGLTLTNGMIGLVAQGDRTVVTRCAVAAPAEAGLALTGNDVSVSRCSVTGAGDASIAYEATSSWSSSLFERNTLFNGGGAPIDARGGQLLVLRNTCGLMGSALDLHPTHDELFSVVSRNRLEGIEIHATQTYGIAIERNRIRRAAGTGIWVSNDLDGVFVLDNDIAQTTAAGVEATFPRGIIRGNRVRHAAEAGIWVKPGASAGETTVEDNDVRHASFDGLRIEGDGNTVRHNRLEKILGDGIEILSGDGNVVTDNVASSNLHEGIDNSGTGTVIEGNVARHNGGGAGPDIAGAGKGGVGTVASFASNSYGTGGQTTLQANDPPK